MRNTASLRPIRSNPLRAGLAALLVLSLGSSLATAQSVTTAPPPPADLTLMQSRVTELENALRDANRNADDLSRENFRLRLENERLKRALETAEQAAMSVGGGAATQAPSPTIPAIPPAPSPVSSATPTTSPLPPSEAELAAYRAAVNLAPRDPAAAETALRQFLDTYPNSQRFGEASYFLGRTQYVQRKWNAAAATFLDIVEKTPRAPRAPESLIWLGAALREDGIATGSAAKIRTGCNLFRELPERFPAATQQMRQQARDELARAAVPGGPPICANS